MKRGIILTAKKYTELARAQTYQAPIASMGATWLPLRPQGAFLAYIYRRICSDFLSFSPSHARGRKLHLVFLPTYLPSSDVYLFRASLLCDFLFRLNLASHMIYDSFAWALRSYFRVDNHFPTKSQVLLKSAGKVARQNHDFARLVKMSSSLLWLAAAGKARGKLLSTTHKSCFCYLMICVDLTFSF